MSDEMSTMTLDRTEFETDLGETVAGEEPLLVDSLQANMTALGSVQTHTMTAAQSAVGAVSAEGDATMSGSAVGKVDARDATIRQSAAGAVISDGDATVSQSFSPLIVATKVGLENSAAGMIVADETEIARGWVGLLVGRKVTVSEGGRVIIDARAALILGAVAFGIFGLLAVAAFLAARRVMAATSELARSGRAVDFSAVPRWVARMARVQTD